MSTYFFHSLCRLHEPLTDLVADMGQGLMAQTWHRRDAVEVPDHGLRHRWEQDPGKWPTVKAVYALAMVIGHALYLHDHISNQFSSSRKRRSGSKQHVWSSYICIKEGKAVEPWTNLHY